MKRGLKCAFVLVLIYTLLGVGTQSKKAYIFMGNIDQKWYSDLIRSTTGEVDHWKELQPLFEEQITELKKRGFEIQTSKVALYDNVAHFGIPSELKKALLDPETKAIVWFGHGDEDTPGQLYTQLRTADDKDVTLPPSTIKEWAQQSLKKEIGVPSEWKNLSKEERARRRKLWDNAHFNLEYAYFHVCYGMKNNDLPEILMAKQGEFHGYKGVATLKNESTSWKKPSSLAEALKTYKYEFGWSGGEANDWDDSKASYYTVTGVSVDGKYVKMSYDWKAGMLKCTIEGNALNCSYEQSNGSGKCGLEFDAHYSFATGWWYDNRDKAKHAAFMRKLK